MSKPKTAEHHQPSMKRILHESRREEVAERFFVTLENDPLLSGAERLWEWDMIRRQYFNAAYDYYDACGPRDAIDFAQEQHAVMQKMLQFGLASSIPAAERQLDLMEGLAFEAISEVHPTAYDRARMHTVTKPYARAASTPLLLPAPDLPVRTESFFQRHNDAFWRNHQPTDRMRALYLDSSITVADVECALHHTLARFGVPVAKPPRLDQYRTPAHEVCEFLVGQGMDRDATHVWLLHQFENKFIALVNETTHDIGLKPGATRRGQWGDFHAEFEKRLTPFKHDLSDKQEAIMGMEGREEFVRDMMAIERSMRRCMGLYLANGPVIENGSRSV